MKNETGSTEKKKRSLGRLLLLILIGGAAIGTILVLWINWYMISYAKRYILSQEEAAAIKADCILVLGAGVWDGEPSPMLRDRLDLGIKLWQLGTSPKLLMSGDHGRENYDEVNVMKDYAIAAGILSSNIFMDHAGFSTYDSVYRAREIFQTKTVVIVTQEYHMYRAVYAARKLGLEAYGVCTDTEYSGQWMREVREVAARVKDFFYVLLKVPPTYLGEAIPVSGDGDITND